MKKPISRRDFLKQSALGVASLSSLDLIVPKVTNAQGVNGPKVGVFLQMLGGQDPFLLTTYTTEYEALAQLRGNYARVEPTGAEISPGIAINSELMRLEPYLDKLKIVMNTANAMHLNHLRSHRDAQLRMTLGGNQSTFGRHGWPGRCFDSGVVNVIGFGGTGATYNCETCDVPPLVTSSNLEGFSLNNVSLTNRLGGVKNAQFVTEIIKEFSEIDLAQRGVVRPTEKKYLEAQKAMYLRLGEIDDIIAVQTPKHQDYIDQASTLPPDDQGGYLSLAKKLRNVAQITKKMKDEGSQESLIVVIGIGGWDIHDNWLPRGMRLMRQVGLGLRVFSDDLQSMSLLPNVVAMTCTEFGRTIKGNGNGTDHGVAHFAMFLGGRVNGGVYGDRIPVSQLITLSQGANGWPREVAQEALIIEVLEKHLGVDGRLAFPEPLYSEINIPGDLNLLT